MTTAKVPLISVAEVRNVREYLLMFEEVLAFRDLIGLPTRTIPVAVLLRFGSTIEALWPFVEAWAGMSCPKAVRNNTPETAYNACGDPSHLPCQARALLAEAKATTATPP
mgnify:CR=1 FL=1